MAARSASQAFEAYIYPLQWAVASFAENMQFRRGGTDPAVGAEVLLTATGDPIALCDAYGTECLALSLRLHFRIEHVSSSPRRWETRTVAYSYGLKDPADVRREIAGYHWHPHVPGIAYPHLHAYTAPPPTDRLHFPTGYITLKDVLGFAMRDFDVHPLQGKGGWREALDTLDTVFRASLAWAPQSQVLPSARLHR